MPTVEFGGELVQSLSAVLRVEDGQVLLDGDAKVGQPNVVGGIPAVKETMDAVYVTDGFIGGSVFDAVYSDNGSSNPYDLGDIDIEMPQLDLPYEDDLGNYYPDYLTYLRSNALVITGDLVLEHGTEVPFVSNGLGSIGLDAAGNLLISGIVYVEGNIAIEGDGDIVYDGQGTLVSTGDVSIYTSFYSREVFPTDDVVGVVAHGELALGDEGLEHLHMAGAFFAQENVSNGMQNHVLGTLVSNHFTMTQVPNIYQVPCLVENLPPGMPGGDDASRLAWRRVPRSWVELD